MVDPRDLVAQGDPDTVVLLPDCTLLGLYIRGVEGQVMLGIKEDREGYPVSCGVGIAMDTTSVPHQMNPRRIITPGED